MTTITIQQALTSAKTQDTPQFIPIDNSDLHYAMQYVLKKNLAYIRCYPNQLLTTEQAQQWQQILRRLNTGEPLAYIVGTKAFWTLDLMVTPATLTPRPDTEILVETALNSFDANHNISVLDLGTGSGAIALAIASERPNWQITATDFSLEALTIAKKNAIKNKLEQVHFLQGNWFEALSSHSQKFDLIVSNPPYIDKRDPHLKNLSFEPYSALVAENTGLADLTHIIQQAKHWLNPQGQLWLEHGYDQCNAVRQLLTEAEFIQVKTIKDYGGNDRVSGGLKR